MHSPLWPLSSQLCGSFSRTSSLSTDETKGLRSGNFLTWNASNCYCFPHITATGYHLKRGFSSSPEIPAIWKQGGATTPPPVASHRLCPTAQLTPLQAAAAHYSRKRFLLIPHGGHPQGGTANFDGELLSIAKKEGTYSFALGQNISKANTKS